VKKGRLMKVKKRLSHNRQISLKRDRWPGGISRTQVAHELIPQGGPAIQATISPSGYVSVSEELWGKRRVTPSLLCVPLQIERH
jgi:hypothetical protein